MDNTDRYSAGVLDNPRQPVEFASRTLSQVEQR